MQKLPDDYCGLDLRFPMALEVRVCPGTNLVWHQIDSVFGPMLEH